MATPGSIEKNFWAWFGRGSGGGPGYLRIVNRKLWIDLVIGTILGFAVTKSLPDTGCTVLFPLAAVLVGMVFAWAGSAQALLQADEIVTIAKFVPGGYPEYVFTFQLSILVILITCVSWGIAALGVLEGLSPDLHKVTTCFLYAITSLSIRKLWSMVLFSQAMLLMRVELQQARLKRKTEEAEKTTPPV